MATCDRATAGWRTPTAWILANSFHTTFWFAPVEIFRNCQPPWFRFVYSDDGREMLQCECQFFRDRVVGAGFSVQSGGWCGMGARRSSAGEELHRPASRSSWCWIGPWRRDGCAGMSTKGSANEGAVGLAESRSARCWKRDSGRHLDTE